MNIYIYIYIYIYICITIHMINSIQHTYNKLTNIQQATVGGRDGA